MEPYKSLLKSRPILPPNQTRAFNHLNGSDAESLAASRLVTACRGEICWGSREEDNRKIDLILSCDHPWYPGERLLILSQVKSGDTFGMRNELGFKLKGAALRAAKRTSHSVCMVWVDRSTGESFWAYVHPDTKLTPRDYGLHHKITPATVFDLARCMSRNISNMKGGRGIVVRSRTGNVTERRKTVRSTYRSLASVFSPTLGKIELTRLGWRHMLRSGRSQANKKASLELIPYLPKLVAQTPTTNAVTNIKEWKSDDYTYRVTEHLLRYSEVSYSEKNQTGTKNIEVILKVLEEIRYPTDWQNDAMLSQRVERRLVLKSAYHKAVKGS
ncbi:MAG: hypothetical protein JJ921_02130 [Pseudomonadales bacterium]|nr:hypothetical protein [Pseudomonadales bacterium]MBO7005045.1 hypothetical protein [Pseudomonadales bacterium]